MVMVSILSLGGGGAASKYGVDGYKPPDRVWFLRVAILNIGIPGDFCNNYLPKIEFFKTRSGLSQLRRKKTPLGHLLNETQGPFSSSTNFLKRKI